MSALYCPVLGYVGYFFMIFDHFINKNKKLCPAKMNSFGENILVSAFHITQRVSTVMNKEHLKLSRDACRTRKISEETLSVIGKQPC